MSNLPSPSPSPVAGTISGFGTRDSRQLAKISVYTQELSTQNEFAPRVTATCKSGTMNIKVKFNGPYTGAVHARDHRNAACMAMGDGSDAVGFSINLLAKQGASDYCGVLVSNVSGANVS
ncbi:unnamed protein product [Ceratitis capitata]|uniref:(Mediterranean fruit fly) hypothetical protein n=1 Tax=Ceratitis capitata TaxID=7213 RepID=A0A811U5U1_CERCA|nr:unnamed protein product [Ceratitis capitata]